MPHLTLGKYRGLQQIGDRDGIFAITALDHRGTFRRMIEGAIGRAPDWDEVVAEKIRLAEALLPISTAVLLDPLFGGPVIARGAIPAGVGALLTRERSGADGEDHARRTVLQDGWSVAGSARAGAVGIKLLMFYHPQSTVAAAQEEIVAGVVEECRQHDMVMILEPICYPIVPGQQRTDPAFAETLPDMVVETAKRLVPMGVDLLKAEYPTVPGFDDDPASGLAACRRITEAVDVPWVLLSGGVDFPLFQQQLEIACDAGASGFLAGRAIWKEAFTMPDPAARTEFLNTVAVARMDVLNAVARHRATPWMDRVPPANLPAPKDGWHLTV